MKTIYIYFSVLLIPFTAFSQDRFADSLILVEVFNQLDGPNWNNPDNWLTDAPLEDWRGIIIQNNRVVQLNIISQNPTGPFPEQIIGLDQLTTFEVRNGNMTGKLPSSLQQLNKLTRFSVSGNDMSGEVPNIWTQFPNLRFLILRDNNFTGPLPAIPNGLTLFYASRNQFSGPIPESWNDVLLSNVNIADNELTGNLDIFSTWTILSSMDFSDNNWDEGPLPLWLDTLNNLNSFICSNCNFVGVIPAGFDLRDNLVHEQIILDGNSIRGDVAALFIGPNSDKKLFLNVSGNQFSGNFPSHLIHSASSVDIRNNNYTSLTSFPEDVDFDGRFSIEFNQFNYEALEPMSAWIPQNGDLEVRYGNMRQTLSPDTLHITAPTTITMLSGDNHPNTTYQWVGPQVQGLTTSSVDLVIDELSFGGTYRCLMTNDSFPNLNLRRHDIVITTDFSTSTIDKAIPKFKLYPNPSQDYMYIDIENLSKSEVYQLISKEGEIVLTGAIDDRIDLQHLPSGIYYLSINIEGKNHIQPIVKF